ncbi:MAG TPA: L-threonylcarbamoyladenylate synthase [Blastocatellia bacterium]|nr:L-threonylcarbamoyladenylate synthase [Blastocatellia bacterium]
MTVVLRLDPEDPDVDDIEQAATVIQQGGLVAFPTETVYGLGADAMNEAAVQKIFEAKGRPADNPVIVHISNIDMLERVATGVSRTAKMLAERFWPGPLTLVLKRNTNVAPSISAGLSTIAVRMPRGRIALDLITRAGTPVAAPSANISGRPSPTTASHVATDLEGRIDMILDGGATNIGIESTVLDVTVDPPLILRPGWVTKEMLTEAIGKIGAAASEEELKHSPGTRHRHYSPRARVVLIEHASPMQIARVIRQHLESGEVGFIGHSKIDSSEEGLILFPLRQDAAEYAKSLYSALRELDAREVSTILVEGIAEIGEGAAVMDRLRRAASEVISE